MINFNTCFLVIRYSAEVELKLVGSGEEEASPRMEIFDHRSECPSVGLFAGVCLLASRLGHEAMHEAS